MIKAGETSGNDGYSLIEVAGQPAYRAIKESWIVPAFDITSFAIVGGGVNEVGDTIVTPSFTAAYNRTPTDAELSDNDGNPPKDVTSTPTAFSSDGTFVKTANNATVVFTLNAEEDGEVDARVATMYWRPLTMYGVSTSTGPYDEAFIEALANQQLDNNRQTTFTVTAGANEYIFYAYPSAYGTGTFWVGGFEGGFSLVGTISVTNAYGVTQNYYLYRSDNHSLGSTTVQVT
jgi:hypothetical protein